MGSATYIDMDVGIDLDIYHRNSKNIHGQNYERVLSSAVRVFFPCIQQTEEKLLWSSKYFSFFKNITDFFFFFKPFRVKRAQFAVFFMHALLQATLIRRSCI